MSSVARKARECLSVVADFVQVASFVGLTIASIAAISTMILGWLTAVPWFWVIVGGAVMFACVIYGYSKVTGSAPVAQPLKASNGLISLREAATRYYESTENSHTTQMIKISADTQGHDNDQLLSYIAERIVKTGVPLFGKELPSRNSHELDKASFREFTVKGDDIHCTSPIPGLFTDVHVRSEDLPKIQDAIKAWRDSRGN